MTLQEARERLQGLADGRGSQVPPDVLAAVLMALVESQERIERVWAGVSPLQRDLPIRKLSRENQ